MVLKTPEVLSRSKFSPLITVVSLALAGLMFWASSWQWSKYHLKLDLLRSYASNSTAAAQVLPVGELTVSNPASSPAPVQSESADKAARALLRFHKVHVRGRFDFTRQVIVTNRKDKDGPGHLLLAPFILDPAGPAVWVSRGFIPFADREPSSWTKYDEPGTVEFDGVVQEAITPGFLAPSNPEIPPSGPFPRIWFFEEVAQLNRLVDYPALQTIFIQRLGSTGLGRYPEESVQIQVPPSTHFGYTIEWALLGSLTLVAGLLLQIFPVRSRYRSPAMQQRAAVVPRTADGSQKVVSASNEIH